MSEVDDARLAEMMGRAAAIAATMPENLQEAAFNRTLDALLGRNRKPQSTRRSGGHRTAGKVADRGASTGSSDPVAALQGLQRSLGGDVDDQEGALGKALALLRVAHRELDIDGLSAPQIALVLTEKFRWRVTRQAVREALERAGRFVDASRGPRRAVVYRLMASGDAWLDTAAPDRKVPQEGGKTKARKRGAKQAGDEKVSAGHPRSRQADPAGAGSEPRRGDKSGARRGSAKPGPKAEVETLITAGWFAVPRTLVALRTQLAEGRALRYKSTDLSPVLTRLLRTGQLSRSKSPDGQYEYVASNS